MIDIHKKFKIINLGFSKINASESCHLLIIRYLCNMKFPNYFSIRIYPERGGL